MGERQVSSVSSVTSWLLLNYYDEISQKNGFWPGDLDLWPMTLTFKLDLDILPLDLHTKIQGCTFVRSPLRARHTDTHTQTDRETMPKLLHPSLTRGVKMSDFSWKVGPMVIWPYLQWPFKVHFFGSSRSPWTLQWSWMVKTHLTLKGHCK